LQDIGLFAESQCTEDEHDDEDEDDSSSENMPGQSFLLALTPSRQMPTEKMALKAGENRLMKSYFDI
jgi:hypothetical protein